MAWIAIAGDFRHEGLHYCALGCCLRDGHQYFRRRAGAGDFDRRQRKHQWTRTARRDRRSRPELPNPAPFYIAPDAVSPHTINPNALALISRDFAVAGNLSTHSEFHFVDIIDIPSASITGFFNPGGSADPHAYSGYGTVAPNPAHTHLLLASGTVNQQAGNKLFVVPMPLSSASVASDIVTLPGDFRHRAD